MCVVCLLSSSLSAKPERSVTTLLHTHVEPFIPSCKKKSPLPFLPRCFWQTGCIGRTKETLLCDLFLPLRSDYNKEISLSGAHSALLYVRTFVHSISLWRFVSIREAGGGGREGRTLQ